MAQPSEAQRRLARRLRALRQPSGGPPVTQKQVAEALNASVPLVSSWEGAKAVPPEERLSSYALLFSGPPTMSNGRARLPDPRLLSVEAEAVRRELLKELIALRNAAQGEQEPSQHPAGALGGRFWCYPQNARVRIITTPMWPEVVAQIPYANAWHPNYIQSLLDADRDASLELFGHVRAENPTADVRLITADRLERSNDLTGEVIILGQGDQLFMAQQGTPGVLDYFVRRLELPVGIQRDPDGDPEYDSEFVVTCDEDDEPAYYPAGTTPAGFEAYRPVFLKDVSRDGQPRLERDGYPQLEYDVALIARMENQLNLGATVTICSGLFSRGTYGAVRALTDQNLRAKNEEFLINEFGLQDFWLLTRVPVFLSDSGAETVTPDLARPFNRLRAAGGTG
jgi:transcriptional regulator with XRE-family HTH domain